MCNVYQLIFTRRERCFAHQLHNSQKNAKHEHEAHVQIRTHIVSGCAMLDNCSLGGLTSLGNNFDLCPALSVQRCDPCFLCVPAFLVCCMLVCVCLCGYYSNTSHLYIKCFPTYLPHFILLPGPQTNEFIVMA